MKSLTKNIYQEILIQFKDKASIAVGILNQLLCQNNGRERFFELTFSQSERKSIEGSTEVEPSEEPGRKNRKTESVWREKSEGKEFFMKKEGRESEETTGKMALIVLRCSILLCGSTDIYWVGGKISCVSIECYLCL